ncbi:hypothetical protein BVX93_01380, partial [bacterium B13(2017)]
MEWANEEYNTALTQIAQGFDFTGDSVDMLLAVWLFADTETGLLASDIEINGLTEEETKLFIALYNSFISGESIDNSILGEILGADTEGNIPDGTEIPGLLNTENEFIELFQLGEARDETQEARYNELKEIILQELGVAEESFDVTIQSMLDSDPPEDLPGVSNDMDLFIELYNSGDFEGAAYLTLKQKVEQALKDNNFDTLKQTIIDNLQSEFETELQSGSEMGKALLAVIIGAGSDGLLHRGINLSGLTSDEEMFINLYNAKIAGYDYSVFEYLAILLGADENGMIPEGSVFEGLTDTESEFIELFNRRDILETLPVDDPERMRYEELKAIVLDGLFLEDETEFDESIQTLIDEGRDIPGVRDENKDFIEMFNSKDFFNEDYKTLKNKIIDEFDEVFESIKNEIISNLNLSSESLTDLIFARLVGVGSDGMISGGAKIFGLNDYIEGDPVIIQGGDIPFGREDLLKGTPLRVLRNLTIGDMDLQEIPPVAGEIMEVSQYNFKGVPVESVTTSFIYNETGDRVYSQVTIISNQFNRSSNEGDIIGTITRTYNLVYSVGDIWRASTASLANISNYNQVLMDIQKKTILEHDKRGNPTKVRIDNYKVFDEEEDENTHGFVYFDEEGNEVSEDDPSAIKYIGTTGEIRESEYNWKGNVKNSVTWSYVVLPDGSIRFVEKKVTDNEFDNWGNVKRSVTK